MAMARPTPLDPPGRVGQGRRAFRTERPSHVQNAGASANSRRGFGRNSRDARPSAPPARRGGPHGRDLLCPVCFPFRRPGVDPPAHRLERRRLGLSRPDRANDGATRAGPARPGAARGRESVGARAPRRRGGLRRARGDRLGAGPGEEHGRACSRRGIWRSSARRILSAWTFIQGHVRDPLCGRLFPAVADGRSAAASNFPASPSRGWGEFVYQAFTVGCTFASSDVNVTSTPDAPHLRDPGRRRRSSSTRSSSPSPSTSRPTSSDRQRPHEPERP